MLFRRSAVALVIAALPTILLAQGEKDATGSGARQRAMGGAGIAGARGHDALYYNAASLASSWNLVGGAELSLTLPAASVSSPSGDFNNNAEGDLYALGYAHVGIAGPVSYNNCPTCDSKNAEFPHDCPACGTPYAPVDPGGFLTRLFWGASLDLSLRNVGYVNTTSDQSNPEWMRYGRAQEQLTASGGVAYRITDWIAAGISVSFLYSTFGSIHNDFFALSSTPSNISFEQKTKYFLALNAGILVSPSDRLHFGLSYRSEQAANVENDSVTNVDTFGLPADVVILIEATTNYSPQQLGFGASWRISDSWTVIADVVWMDWSEYPGPYSYLTEKEDGPAVTPPHPNIRFKDTFVPKLGAEYAVSKTWKLRAGYGFHPSPAPDQGGTTNVIDSDVHIITLGAAHDLSADFRIEGYFQWHLLAGQSVTESNSSAVPNRWEVTGSFLVFGLGIRWSM